VDNGRDDTLSTVYRLANVGVRVFDRAGGKITLTKQGTVLTETASALKRQVTLLY